MAMERAMGLKPKKEKHGEDPTSDLHLLRSEAIRLIGFASSVGAIFKNPDVRNNLDDEKLTTQRMGALSKDLHQLKADLDSIEKECSVANIGKITESNIMELMHIGEKYHLWLNRYRGVIEPNLVQITQDIERALANHEAKGVQ